MLINLRLIPKNNQLLFDLPPINFDPKQEVCVTQLFIKWEKTVSNPAIILSSSLIDKSICNPMQQLIFVYQKGNSKFLNFTPTQKLYYKIQCLDLQSSLFQIQNIDNTKLEIIEYIFLQLEVSE